MPPYDAKKVANYFLAKQTERDQPITQMKLHKLLYFAHGWHLGLRGEPLLDEMIEAWEFGPVVPSIYQEFKRFGARPIEGRAKDLDRDWKRLIEPEIDRDDDSTRALLDRVWDVYGRFTPSQLSAMTHRPDEPWTSTRKLHPNLRGVDIPNDLIQNHFEEKAEADGGQPSV
jgi:uncharacterized phage-associated protein